MSRSQKLTLLNNFYNLETGKRNQAAFLDVDLLFAKAVKKKALDAEIRNCMRCDGMNLPCQTEGAPGWGNLNSKIVIVGQSLCTDCMNTGIPFTRGSGYLLDAVLSLCALERKDVFITNLVHCHPPHNRPSTPKEIRNCAPFLLREIDIIRPELVVTLGTDARESFSKLIRGKEIKYKVSNFKHPAFYLHAGWEGAVEWIVNLATKLEKFK